MAFSAKKSKNPIRNQGPALHGSDPEKPQLSKSNASDESYILDENETREMIKPKALEDAKVKTLIECLTDWIHDELTEKHIIVRDIVEDMYDGQVFAVLTEKLAHIKLDVPEVTQAVSAQKERLQVVLDHIRNWLHPKDNKYLTVEKIYSKNVIAILLLLVELSKQSRNPPKLPNDVILPVVSVKMVGGRLIVNTIKEIITEGSQRDKGSAQSQQAKDVFDVLFEQSREKLQIVQRSLIAFANKHLSKLNLEVTDTKTQFHDGVNLIVLTGLLEGYFVPLYKYYPTPTDKDQKIHNVTLALELMEDNEQLSGRVFPSDIVAKDAKSTLRVLYHLYSLYKNAE